MKYYKVLVIASDVTKPDTEPKENCIIFYQNEQELGNEQIEEKVRESFKKHPEYTYDKVNYFREISELEYVAGAKASFFFDKF